MQGLLQVKSGSAHVRPVVQQYLECVHTAQYIYRLYWLYCLYWLYYPPLATACVYLRRLRTGLTQIAGRRKVRTHAYVVQRSAAPRVKSIHLRASR